jgi:hypothetical protein
MVILVADVKGGVVGYTIVGSLGSVWEVLCWLLKAGSMSSSILICY